MSIEVMRQVLEVFGGGDWHEEAVSSAWADKANQAIEALRQAIEQAEKNEFNPDWDAMAVMVEEQQRMAKRIEELEQEKFCDNHCVWTDHHPDCAIEKQEPLYTPSPQCQPLSKKQND